MDTSVVHGRTRGGMENRHVLRRLAPPQDGMVWQGRGVPGGGVVRRGLGEAAARRWAAAAGGQGSQRGRSYASPTQNINPIT